MKSVKLLEKLISIPSFVDNKNNEAKLCVFLENYIKRNFKQFATQRQYIDKNKERFNLFVGNNNPEILFVGHIDTVQPVSGWKTGPFRAVVKNGNIYGLGTADMKGSIAPLLAALEQIYNKINTDKISVLFYVDEEYDFRGMKKFCQDIELRKPRVVISLDGNLQVSSGCRGCIELNIKFGSIGGHSSKPFLGVNTITNTAKLTGLLENDLSKYFDKELGYSTVNLAYLRGGTISKDFWQREGNIIPSFVDCTIEVRPSVKTINANYVVRKIKKISQLLNLKILDIGIRHDLRPWPVNYKSNELDVIREVYKKEDISFSVANRTFSGYLDLQLLVDKIDCPMFVIGAGGKNYHAPNESVSILEVTRAQQIYEGIILEYCKL